MPYIARWRIVRSVSLAGLQACAKGEPGGEVPSILARDFGLVAISRRFSNFCPVPRFLCFTMKCAESLMSAMAIFRQLREQLTAYCCFATASL